MTISSTNRKAGPYTGTGLVSAYPFYFKVFQASDLYVVRLDPVTLQETVLVLNTDYTVALNANQNNNPGGTVNLTAPLTVNYELTITSDIADLQPTDLTNQGGFYPAVINDALDRACIQIQQLAEGASRALTLPVSVAGVNTELPAPIGGNFIAWNASANGLQNIEPSALVTIVAFGTARYDLFSGTGAQTTFTLTASPGALANLDVSISGVTQRPGTDYTWSSGTALTFTSAPPSGTNNILVRYMQGLAQGTSDSASSQFIQGGTGAVMRVAQDKMRESVSVKDFGAVGDGVTDDTAAIQAAINYASSNNFLMYVPAATYIVNATTAITGAWASTYSPVGALQLKSNLHIRADEGAVFKMKAGISSAAAPREFEMFYHTGVGVTLSNISIIGLTMDMNGANNATTVAANTDNAFITCSAPIGGASATANDVLIERCTFINTPGVSCIVMTESNNTSGVTISKRWTVKNCVFRNNGLNVSDHSSIFAWADYVTCIGNLFTADTMCGDSGANATGFKCAYEVHGAYQIFSNNIVTNCFNAMFVSSNYTSATKNVVIDGNVFGPCRGQGIAFFREVAAQEAISNVVISNNAFELSDDSLTVNVKNAIDLQSTYKITDVTVSGNTLVKTGSTVAATFAHVTAPGTYAGNGHDRIVFKGNTVYNASIAFYLTSQESLGAIDITANSVHNTVAAGAYAQANCVYVNGAAALSYLRISDNYFNQSGAYGVQVAGNVTNLYMGPNGYVGVATANYFENGVTINNRDGFYENVAWTPTLTGWTNVGTPSFAGTTWTRVGKLVFVTINITPATSVSAALGTSTITGLPFFPVNYVAGQQINSGSLQNYGSVSVYANGTIYPQAISATAGKITISFCYQAL